MMGLYQNQNDKAGILSETDRDVLENADVTLSPGARQKAFDSAILPLYDTEQRLRNRLY